MDVTQLQPAIEQILNYVHENGTEGIAQLTNILGLLKAGVTSIGSLAMLVSKWPALVEMWSQLIALVNAGAGVPEIATAISQLATGIGISIEAVTQFLEGIAALLFFV